MKTNDRVQCLLTRRDGKIAATLGDLAWIKWDDMGDCLMRLSELTLRPIFCVGDMVQQKTGNRRRAEVLGVHTNGIWIEWQNYNIGYQLATYTNETAYDVLEVVPSENQMTE